MAGFVCPHDSVDGDGLGHASECLRAETDGREQSGGELTGIGADYQRAWPGQGLEPCGDMRRCPDNIHGGVANLAGHHEAGMNADADRKRLVEPGAELLQLLEYAQTGVQRTWRVVFVRGRVAKEHEQAVAEILGNMTAKTVNDLGAGRMIRAEHIAHRRILPAADSKNCSPDTGWPAGCHTRYKTSSQPDSQNRNSCTAYLARPHSSIAVAAGIANRAATRLCA